MRVVITSGYFDPLHVGHLEYLERSKQLGDVLVVIVNNDMQAKLKKGRSFMPEEDRVKIIESLRCVDRVYLSTDTDASVVETLREIHRRWSGPHNELIFTKGGDRHIDEIPEASTCRELGIMILEGLGGKVRSSSEFIAKAKEEPK